MIKLISKQLILYTLLVFNFVKVYINVDYIEMKYLLSNLKWYQYYK